MLNKYRLRLVKTLEGLGMSSTEIRIVFFGFSVSFLLPLLATAGRRAGGLDWLRTSVPQTLLALGAVLLPLWLLLSLFFAIVGSTRGMDAHPVVDDPESE